MKNDTLGLAYPDNPSFHAHRSCLGRVVDIEGRPANQTHKNSNWVKRTPHFKLIMPCDYKKYPPNWKTEIRPRILARAKNRCELCGAENGSYGYRGPYGRWFDAEYINKQLEQGVDLFADGEDLDHCFDKNGNPTKPTKIVLTVAHWHNPDPMDCRLENLKAACQYCHLSHDSKQHQESARLTREAKAGLQRLF